MLSQGSYWTDFLKAPHPFKRQSSLALARIWTEKNEKFSSGISYVSESTEK